MAFVLDTSSSYYWPVVFYIPVDDEEKQKIEFTAKYKRLPQKRINQILARIKKKSIKNKIDIKITKRIWKNMIWSYIDFEKRNVKKK